MRLARVFALVIASQLVLMSWGCGKPGTPQNPSSGGQTVQSVSSGVINSLSAIQGSLQVLVDAGKNQFKPELDAITRVLAAAKPINDDIQSNAFSGSTDDKITALTNLASSLAVQFGAGSSFIIAINVGVQLFKSIRNAFKPTATGQAKTPVDYGAKKAEFDAKVEAYKAELAKRSK